MIGDYKCAHLQLVKHTLNPLLVQNYIHIAQGLSFAKVQVII